jgi:putative PIN family toxin of toxin-antitoxin system
VNRWRVVLDTNVLISAYRFGGKPEIILFMALSDAFVSLTSRPLSTELASVLAEKFHVSDQSIRETCAPFWDLAEWVDPKRQVRLCSDEDDNRVLECAIEGMADFIVTGDRHLLNLQSVANTSILKPDAFLTFFQTSSFKIDASKHPLY